MHKIHARIYVSVNCQSAVASGLLSLCVLSLFVASAPTKASDAPTAIVPFEELLRRPVALRPDLKGRHPRVFFTAESLAELRARARTTHKKLWTQTTRRVRALDEQPYLPDAPELDRAPAQYDAAYIIAEATFAYAIERDPRYLKAAKKWLMTVIKYDPWGYTYRTPNVDLPPAHLLYAVAFAYDTLYHDLTNEERAAVRAKLTRQARLMYDYFKYKPKKRYAYSQNHSFIPMAGLSIAAFALMDEEPEAQEWARLARAIYDRVLTTFGTDGYFYEGFHYLVFSFHWIVRYMDALEHATGEDLYPQMRPRFLPIKYYVAHSMLPDGKGVFDFGDTGRGAPERSKRESATFNSSFEILYRLAAKYQDAGTQGVAEWLRRDLHHTTWEDHWSFYSYDAKLKATPITALPTAYHFKDNDTAFWRSSWDTSATAFAFRCAPPEGHDATELIPRIPDWRQSTGHAHPDANSFIIYANGQYLTGDTGYTGVKLTSNHNTVLVGDQGQERDGRHEVFKNVPYERLNQIRIAEEWSSPEYFYARGDATAAYSPELGLTSFQRHFLYAAPDYFIIWDELAANKPHQFSWLINAEQTIATLDTAPTLHALINKDAALLVRRVLPANIAVKTMPQMVTAQGRPGSIEKGTQEQRGEQLIVKTTEPERATEFLHLLRPSTAVRSAMSQVSLESQVTLESAASDFSSRTLRVNWMNNANKATGIEYITLRTAQPQTRTLPAVNRVAIKDTGAPETDAARSILQLSPGMSWQRIVLHDGTRLTHNGATFIKTDKPVAASFARRAAGWQGTVSSDSPTAITLRVEREPRGLRINNQPAKFSYDRRKRTATFTVGAGTSRIATE